MNRPASRILKGGRRPRHPDYLNLALRAYSELVRLDARMRPYLQEMVVSQKHEEWMKSVVDPALDKIYGPSNEPPSLPMPRVLTDKEIKQLKRDELALHKLRFVLASMKSKLAKAPPITRSRPLRSGDWSSIGGKFYFPVKKR